MLVSRENIFNKISGIFPFNLAKVDSIRALVEKSDVVYFKEGNLVYMEGASAGNFYIIYEGEIEIFVEEHHSLRALNILHDGDFFGEDVLKQNNIRISGARVLKDTLLIKISKKNLDDFISEKLGFTRAFSIISKTYARLFEIKFKDLSQETIYYIGNPHYFVLLSKFIFSLLIIFFPLLIVLILAMNNLISDSFLLGSGIVLAVVFFSQLLWHYFEWKNDFYLITGKRVINLNKHLIKYDSKFETPLSAINNLEIEKSVFGRIVGFGNLVIKTYTGETLLKNVSSPSEVQSFLELLMALDKTTRRLEERRSFERIVDKSLITNQNSQNLNRESNLNEKSENIQRFSKIIYRTHWIILLRKVLFPSLLLTSIFLLFFFFNANKIPLIKNDFVLLSAGLLIIGALLWWFYQCFDWRNDQYHITDEQIIDIYRRPFGTEDRRTASVLNIQSIRFERKGILGLILNFGTVYIRVGDEEFTFDNVPDPARIQERLFSILEMSMARIKKSELTEQQQKLAEWMETYHQIREKKSNG